jgi:phosphate transport system permease protein
MASTSLGLRESYAPLDLSAQGGWRSIKNRLMSGLLFLSFLVVMIPLLFVLAAVVSRGAKVMGWSFLTKDIAPIERRPGGGVGPAIVGTLVVTGLATLLATPLGIMGAVFLNEYSAKGVFGRIVRFMANVMTGVPSVVMGLFIYVIFTLTFKQRGVGGSLALACLMLPIIIRTTEEMLKLVPNYLREASLALGTSKARTIVTVVLPAALPGIISGALLAVARAAGETAPLLFTIGAAKSLQINPFADEAMTALPLQIYGNASSSFPAAQARGWGAALTLLLLSFLFTLIARLVSARFATKR